MDRRLCRGFLSNGHTSERSRNSLATNQLSCEMMNTNQEILIEIHFTGLGNVLHIPDGSTHKHANKKLQLSTKRIWIKPRESVGREQLSDLCPWLFQPFAPPLLVS